MLTVIVLVCRLLDGTPECKSVTALKDLPMSACPFAQLGLAQWKENSQYRDWTIKGYRCQMGERA